MASTPTGKTFPRLLARAGDRAPDVDLLESSLYDLIHDGHHHLLLLQGGHLSQQAEEHLRELARYLHGKLRDLARVHVVSHQPLALPEGPLNRVDSHSHLHLRYGGKEDSLYWLRPEGYIGYRSQPAEAEPFLDYLKSIYPF